MTIYFCNDEPMNALATKVFGVNSKVTDNAIGMFGTGLKYAIAIILKNNGKIYTRIADKLANYTTKTKTIRDKEFNVIYHGRKEQAFTTELGSTWSLWEAYRELYSNTKDECGIITDVYDVASRYKNGTIIAVDHEEFERIYSTDNEYFLDTNKLNFIHSSDNCDIFSDVLPHSIFYKGIYTNGYGVNEKYKYTYNIKQNMELTENRTFKWGVSSVITKLIQEIASKQIIIDILEDKDCYEYKLLSNIDNWELIVDTEFYNIALEIARVKPTLLPSKLYEHLFKRILNTECSFQYNNEGTLLSKALQFCAEIGYVVDKQVQLMDISSDKLSFNADETIYLYKETLALSYVELAKVIIKEHLLLANTSIEDYVFDKWISAEEYILLKKGIKI